MSIIRELVTKLKFNADLPAVKKFDSAVTKLGRGVQGVESKMQRAKMAVGALSGGFLAVTATIAGVTAVVAGLTGAFVTVSDKMRSFTARLEVATGSATVGAQSLKLLADMAKRTGTSLDATVDTFQRFSMSKESLGATNDDLLELTENVQKLGVISGASAEAQGNALLQFGQAMNKGALQAEEFRSLQENMPSLVKEIAAGMGIAQDELVRRVVDPKVVVEARDVYDGLMKRTQQINKDFAKMPMTFSRIRNAWSIGFDEGIQYLDKTVNVNDRLFGALGRVGQAVADLAGNNKELIATGLDVFINVVEEALRGLERGIRFVEDALDTMKEHPLITGGILGTVTALVAGLGATMFASTIPAIWGAVTATWGFTAALLANPVTWITAGIVALGVAIVAVAKNWDYIREKAQQALSFIIDKVMQVKNAVANMLGGLMNGRISIGLPKIGQSSVQSQASGGNSSRTANLNMPTNITNNFAPGASSASVSGLTGRALQSAIFSGMQALEGF